MEMEIKMTIKIKIKMGPDSYREGMGMGPDGYRNGNECETNQGYIFSVQVAPKVSRTPTEILKRTNLAGQKKKAPRPRKWSGT